MGSIVPIVDIVAEYGKGLKRTFPGGEVFDILEESPGYQANEEFTFTFRLSLDMESEEGQQEAGRICQALRAQVPDDAERLIALLEEHEWEVSFLADFF